MNDPVGDLLRNELPREVLEAGGGLLLECDVAPRDILIAWASGIDLRQYRKLSMNGVSHSAILEVWKLGVPLIEYLFALSCEVKHESVITAWRQGVGAAAYAAAVSNGLEDAAIFLCHGLNIKLEDYALLRHLYSLSVDELREVKAARGEGSLYVNSRLRGWDHDQALRESCSGGWR